MVSFIKLNKRKVFNYNNILFTLFLVASLFSRLNSEFSFIDILAQLSFQIIICGILLSLFFIFHKRFWLSFICIIVCAFIGGDIFSSCSNCNAFLEDKLQKYRKIRLMTFNIGFSNDFHNLRKQILFEKPDIILLQEVSSQIQKQLKFLESFFPYNSGLDKPLKTFSSIILSKYPLKNERVTNYNTVIANVILDNREFTLIGVHLSPPLDEFLGKIYIDMYFTYSNAIRPQVLPEANLRLAIDQMNFIKLLVKKIDENLILIGDLNMTPTSRRFNKFLKEANLYTYTSFKNPTSTWPSFLPKFLGIQIDHVLFSKNFKVIEKKTANYRTSDHRLLIVDLAFLK